MLSTWGQGSLNSAPVTTSHPRRQGLCLISFFVGNYRHWLKEGKEVLSGVGAGGGKFILGFKLLNMNRSGRWVSRSHLAPALLRSAISRVEQRRMPLGVGRGSKKRCFEAQGNSAMVWRKNHGIKSRRTKVFIRILNVLEENVLKGNIQG